MKHYLNVLNEVDTLYNFASIFELLECLICQGSGYQPAPLKLPFLATCWVWRAELLNPLLSLSLSFFFNFTNSNET